MISMIYYYSASLFISSQSFPLPGSYHFRFLTTIGAYTAWLDILNDEDIVPLYNGGYVCKVSRATNILFRDSSISNHGGSLFFVVIVLF